MKCIRSVDIKSVAMVNHILGCPHKEGTTARFFGDPPQTPLEQTQQIIRRHAVL